MALDKIDRRKKELQAEIDRIEENYIRKASGIERKVKGILKPVYNIRKKPFTSVAISVAVGMTIGYLSKKKSKPSKPQDSSRSVSNGKSNTGFTTLLMAELKRLAAQRAMMYISELIDQRVMPAIASDNNDKKEKAAQKQAVTKKE